MPDNEKKEPRKIGLDARLLCVAKKVPAGARLADIGTDHAYLPVWLLQRGRISACIATDIRKGPLERAKKNIEKYRFDRQATLRLSDGLNGLSRDECDTIVIAGMGGETIADIIANAPFEPDGGHLFILQPMTAAEELRGFLFSNGFEIIDEDLCLDGDKLYVVICAKRTGAPPPLRDKASPYIGDMLDGAHALYGLYMERTLSRLRKEYNGLAASKKGDGGRMKEIEAAIADINGRKG